MEVNCSTGAQDQGHRLLPLPSSLFPRLAWRSAHATVHSLPNSCASRNVLLSDFAIHLSVRASNAWQANARQTDIKVGRNPRLPMLHCIMNFQHYDPKTESFYASVDYTNSDHAYSHQTMLVPVGGTLVQSSTQCPVLCKKARKRNERPCANCSSSQVKVGMISMWRCVKLMQVVTQCDISPPNTAHLCAKCKRDGKKECPPYVPRSKLQKPESSRATSEDATGTTAVNLLTFTMPFTSLSFRLYSLMLMSRMQPTPIAA